MSPQNVEVARRALDAVTRRDLSALVDLTDPAIEWRSFFAALSEGGEYRGHDGMRSYLTDLDEAFEMLRVEVDDMLDAGDLVLGVGRIHYCGKGSGVSADVAAGWLFKLRGGRLSYFRAFADPDKALEAVGLDA
jgi:ketosteroid isomerase-like protein